MQSDKYYESKRAFPQTLAMHNSVGHEYPGHPPTLQDPSIIQVQICREVQQDVRSTNAT